MSSFTRKPVTTATPAFFKIHPGRPIALRVWGLWAGSSVTVVAGLFLNGDGKTTDATSEVALSGFTGLTANKDEPITPCSEYLRVVRTGGAGLIEAAIAPIMPN